MTKLALALIALALAWRWMSRPRVQHVSEAWLRGQASTPEEPEEAPVVKRQPKGAPSASDAYKRPVGSSGAA